MAGFLTRLDDFDRAVSARVVVSGRDGSPPVWLRALRRASQTGSYGAGWVVLFAVVVSVLEGPLAALTASCCVLGTLILNTSVKLVTRRARPSATAFGHSPTTHSMPSAHTSMAVVGATAMTTAVPELWPLWFGWALILAASRIVLGMHYVSDVAAGALFGALISVAAVAPLMHAVL
jgi:undecaprenyl-diphosphatase